LKTFDRSIVDGPLQKAVWKLAWPTMLQNIIGGMQGVVDHAMVGHFVGHAGNAAIGVSIQLWILMIVFVSSVFTGMGVLVARFAGAGNTEAVNRTVYQAFLAAVLMAVGVMAPLGYFAAPWLLNIVHAAPEVQAVALPFLRIMLVFSFGMLLFFMVSGALRAAGDAKTPLRLGILLTVLNIVFNITLIPMFGANGAAIGTTAASGLVGLVAIWMLFTNRLVVKFSRTMSFAPDWAVIRELFRFGLPAGVQGIAMNIAGVTLVSFIGSLPDSAEAQAAYAVGYTELFSMISWTSSGLMGATAAVAGQNLGAQKPDRAAQAPFAGAKIGLCVAAVIGAAFVLIPGPLLGLFNLNDGVAGQIGRQLLSYLAVSGFLITIALAFTGALQGTGDTKSPLYITIVSQVIVPIGICTLFSSLRPLQSGDIWLAIVCGHFTRATLSVLRFRQGAWRNIKVTAPA
jgi:putative MATE family efflux protein